MSVLKHLKTLQHVSIFSDHLQGARGFLVKVTELEVFYKFFKMVKVRPHTHHTLCCRITTNNFYNLKKTYKNF
jgi:hypothetical protein